MNKSDLDGLEAVLGGLYNTPDSLDGDRSYVMNYIKDLGGWILKCLAVLYRKRPSAFTGLGRLYDYYWVQRG